MEENLKTAQDTKDTLLKKAGTVVGNVKEKAGTLVDKAKESELAGKAKEKVDSLKEGVKSFGSKITDKLPGKK